MSSGIIDPVQLLSEMESLLTSDLFLFVHVPSGRTLDLASLDPFGTFRERKG